MLGSMQMVNDCLVSEYILMQVRLRGYYSSDVSISCGLCVGYLFFKSNGRLVVADTVSQAIMGESGKANRTKVKKKPMGPKWHLVPGQVPKPCLNPNQTADGTSPRNASLHPSVRNSLVISGEVSFHMSLLHPPRKGGHLHGKTSCFPN